MILVFSVSINKIEMWPLTHSHCLTRWRKNFLNFFLNLLLTKGMYMIISMVKLSVNIYLALSALCNRPETILIFHMNAEILGENVRVLSMVTNRLNSGVMSEWGQRKPVPVSFFCSCPPAVLWGWFECDRYDKQALVLPIKKYLTCLLDMKLNPEYCTEHFGLWWLYSASHWQEFLQIVSISRCSIAAKVRDVYATGNEPLQIREMSAFKIHSKQKKHEVF